jgi:predicted GTPase
MNQFVKLEDFYKSLKDIKLINNSVDEKRELVKKYVSNFNANIQNLRIDENIKKQNKEISNLLEETINLIKLVSNDWLKNFDEMIEREKFRSDLSNYFIVIIFGKVKAGKSSLGNFIAKNKLESQKVEFFKYDEAGKKQAIKKLEEIEEDSFATNNLECTVEIQGFKLDGMAWIDTPGLGSMVKENGDLAKEYIQSADYIIYPTSSDSPLQLDEREQLKELFEQNKKVSICITKSDYKDEDECECGSEDGCENCNGGVFRKY